MYFKLKVFEDNRGCFMGSYLNSAVKSILKGIYFIKGNSIQIKVLMEVVESVENNTLNSLILFNVLKNNVVSKIVVLLYIFTVYRKHLYTLNDENYQSNLVSPNKINNILTKNVFSY